MIRFLLATVVATSAIACTDGLPYMVISEAPGALAIDRDPVRDWSSRGGTTSIVAPGTASFPQLVTLRVESRRADDGYQVNDPLADATVDVIDGSACRIAAPLRCMGGICFAEVELSGAGLCQVRAIAATRDGIAIDDCWYRGTWEGDPADATLAARMEEAAEAAHATCLGG